MSYCKTLGEKIYIYIIHTKIDPEERDQITGEYEVPFTKADGRF